MQIFFNPMGRNISLVFPHFISPLKTKCIKKVIMSKKQPMKSRGPIPFVCVIRVFISEVIVPLFILESHTLEWLTHISCPVILLVLIPTELVSSVIILLHYVRFVCIINANRVKLARILGEDRVDQTITFKLLKILSSSKFIYIAIVVIKKECFELRSNRPIVSGPLLVNLNNQ
jgi:hypothetical protein